MSEDALLRPVQTEDPLLGKVLQERYRVIRKIGEGGMGAVYEGEHILIKRRVAIKCLHGQLAQNPEIVARFHREALAATSIGHEHIVEVTDMGRFEDGSVFMVLEFLEGKDWGEDLESTGPQSLGKVVGVISQVADALDAAHGKGIIHRDLKPENVFLISRGGRSNFVKVLDFGISKFKDAADSPGKGMTKTGTTMGTPYYMAPEQAQGKKDIDHRADIYSLGVMIFQALTGQYPFDDESYPMLVLKICTEVPPDLRIYRPDLPEEVEHIVRKALAKDPNERYSNCAELKAALAPYQEVEEKPVIVADAPKTSSMKSSVLSGSGVRDVDPPGGTPVPTDSVYEVPGRSMMPMMLAGGGLAVAAAIGIGIAVAVSSSNNGEPAQPASIIVQQQPTQAPVQPQPVSRAAEAAKPEPKVEMIELAIHTDPEDAELYLDGDRISNPYEGQLPKQAEPRRLEARRARYKTVVQDLVLKYPQKVRIKMKRGRGTEDRRSAESRTRAARATPSGSSASSTSSSAAAARLPPPVAAPAAATPAPAQARPERPAAPTPEVKKRELKKITL